MLACKGVNCGGHMPRILADSRPPLGPVAQAMVVVGAILIILANTMLCTFIVRDSNLWSFVSNNSYFNQLKIHQIEYLSLY